MILLPDPGLQSQVELLQGLPGKGAEQLASDGAEEALDLATPLRGIGGRRKAESAGGEVRDLNTRTLKMSQYDHPTGQYRKKPLSQRWHLLGDESAIVQRDIYSAFLARCVIDNRHHPSHIRGGWRRD
ncbi:hypothetical protein L9S41_19310 [Geoalkalibacter halelectricus]|uniref:Transposase, Mutator family n=1 Tax=Geoalkalibacter halelectricus TaxID=2847045 RepID=A0ABY5ZLR4_9BACT|nr:hypothetical protein [Geoalkalibacter halelectricus]UWZ79794.1 hypothetical protein L9S41_19310 [Geoalkalibacter halelectricus]